MSLYIEYVQSVTAVCKAAAGVIIEKPLHAWHCAFLYCIMTIGVTFPFTLGKLREEILAAITETEPLIED